MRKKVFIVFIVSFILIQFYPVDRNNLVTQPELEIQASEEVIAILEKSCYDCHSNKVRYPFYSYIAPVSWLVSQDVKEGREKLNFSEWGNLSDRKKRRKAEDSFEEIEHEYMPLPIYLYLHSDAVISAEDAAVIEDWSENF